MTKRKKSRKVGKIGIPSAPKADRQPNTSNTRPKKKLGNPSGSRHNIVEQKTQVQGSDNNKDPRFGSKKPIPLIVEEKPLKSDPAPKKAFFTPAQELAHLENDEQLSGLLDEIDAGAMLSKDQQLFVDSKLARHKELCELLGVSHTSETSENTDTAVKKPSENDLFEQFENIDISQFKSE
jgi:ribosome assembly protein YihI (activator of Der GTPase)